MTLEELYSKDIIVYECLSGSHAYGLNTPESDRDIKGVFILPEDEFYGLNYISQVNDEKNDIVYYELRRFIELLSKSNPNILELLYSPEDCIQKLHPVFEPLRKHNFLSKQCKESFGGYAMTQVRKAKGLNKKILNPIEKERKGVLDFCYATHGQNSMPILQFLELKNIAQNQCGLAKMPHMHKIYAVYHGLESFKGLIRKDDPNDVSLSNIPKDLEPIGLMSFNKSAYSKYCKDYKEYWDWVQQRNETGKDGLLNVRRNDREYLLKIKIGSFEYDELLQSAESKVATFDQIFNDSSLPELPDVNMLNKLLYEIRKDFYMFK